MKFCTLKVSNLCSLLIDKINIKYYFFVHCLFDQVFLVYFTFKFGLQGAIIDYEILVLVKRKRLEQSEYLTLIKLYLVLASDSPSSAADM